MLAGELDPNLLLGLPDGSSNEILIRSFLAATWQSHVTTPGIATALRSANQEDALGFGNENESYSGPEERNVFVGG
jgi:hypothetical protein